MGHNYTTVGQIRSLPQRLCKYPDVIFFTYAAKTDFRYFIPCYKPPVKTENDPCDPLGCISPSVCKLCCGGWELHICILEENIIPRHCVLKSSSEYSSQLEVEYI